MSLFLPVPSYDKVPTLHPPGYPAPFEDCVDNDEFLRMFPAPWLRTCDIAINTPPVRILTNICLIDKSTKIVDDVDQTKAFKFQAEDISPGTTREIRIPDDDFIMVGDTTAQTLTNKNITGSTNTVGATQLETATSPVVITSTNPVGSGQVLVTTSSSVATWQPASGLGGGMISYTLTNTRIIATSTAYQTIAVFPWLDSRYNGYSNGIVIFRVSISNRDLDIRLQDVTSATTLGGTTCMTSGTKSFMLTTLPTADAQVELQVRKNANGGGSPIIDGSVIEFDI